MICKTEKDIIRNWKPTANGKPTVSVMCLTFNHEKYITEALDSFLMQETNFPFEVIVHDDASTDATQRIIKEYEVAFPSIIKPIYETENQYSKFRGSMLKTIRAKMTGKYIAFCEGDDKWIFTGKLQEQVTFMEEKPTCALCAHNTVYHCLDQAHEDGLFNPWKKLHKLTEEEVFFGWTIHTSSYLIRSELNYQPDYALGYYFGDYVILTNAFFHGDVYCLPGCYSWYNGRNTKGVSMSVELGDKNHYIWTRQQRIQYLSEYNERTKNKFKTIVQKRINEIELTLLFFSFNLMPKCKENYAQLKKTAEEICRNGYYHDYLDSQSITLRLKTIFKFKLRYFPHIWIRLLR